MTEGPAACQQEDVARVGAKGSHKGSGVSGSGLAGAVSVPVEALTEHTEMAPQISHAVTLTAAPLARGLARLLFVFVAARVLGPRQFGVYALLLAIVEMLAVASGSGYPDYLTREAAKDARVGWGLGEQLTWLRLAGALGLAGAALLIVWALGYPGTVIVAGAWLSLSLAPRSVSESVQGVLRGIGRYAAYLAIELVFDCSLVAGAVFILKRSSGLGAAITTEVIAAIAAGLTSIAFLLAFRTKERIRLDKRQLFEKSIIFNIYTFVGNLYDRLDIVMISKLAGDYATGVYSVAYRPLGMVQLVPYGVLYSLLPALSRNADDVEEQRLERAMGLLLTTAFAAVLVTMVFAGPAVRLLLGQSYAESAVALKILIWAVILRYVNYALGVRLLAGGHERVFVRTSLVCLGVNIVGNLLFIPMYSWRAAAVLTIVTELALFAQLFYWIRRTVGAIPKPLGWARTSLVFAALLALWLLGERFGAPLAVGSASVLLFALYLYRIGLIREFAAAWGLRQERTLGAPNS